MRALSLTLLLLLPLAGCPTVDDDDDSAGTDDDDSALGDDDDSAPVDDDDSARPGDDDDSMAGDDDDSMAGDDDDSMAADDDDSGLGDDDDSGLGDDDDATSPLPCGASDFALSATVTDPAGGLGPVFSASDPLVLSASVENTCPFPVTFSTPSACLFDAWQVSNADSGSGMICAQVVTERTIPVGGSLQEAQPPQVFEPDTWTFFVAFAGGQELTTTFTVQ